MADGFVPGQRWLSDSDTGLGLGTVLKTDARCVHVHFPACGETRMYALHAAPLTRVRFAPGDRLEDMQGNDFAVVEPDEQDGLLVYRVQSTDGRETRISEQNLSHRIRLGRPQDKLAGARIDADEWFTLRYQAWQHLADTARSPLFGLAGARIGLIPHQLYIAAEVGGRAAPRVLLADEVGLGKTIEAGMILHRLTLAERAKRVLIVVPQALIHQWLVEMLRRFNLRFSVFDAERFEDADMENPFQSEQRVLCSLDFLTSRPDIARAALAGAWDLLIVDEAHHLHWEASGSSLEYDLIEALAEHVPGVLLLTATPEQLGRAGHFARLRLLDPQRFHDYQAFLAEEQAYEPVAQLASRLIDREPLDDAQRARLEGLLGDESHAEPDTLIAKLVDRHGTGRVLFRNTRAVIKGFPGREPRLSPLPLPADYAGLTHLPCPEHGFGADWVRIDPRVAWLVETLRALRPDKVLVICARAETVLELSAALMSMHGMHAAVFHEGMEIVERDRAAAYFAAAEDGTQLLICSEIGSEGRNFQFAHHLVLFDLPVEPNLLEQRIGRLDRVGQTETIRIHVPYLENSAGEVLARWYHEGLNAFAAVCPAGGAVFEKLADALNVALAGSGECDALLGETRRLTETLNQALEAGRDRLLEIHSHRPEVSERLLARIREEEDEAGVRRYMERFWDAFGVEHELGPGYSTVLHPGRHMLHDKFPGLPEEGVTVTYGRNDALAHEDREFLTWEHPMVRGALDMLVSDDLGSAALVVAKHADFRAGTSMLELVFLVECPAPAELEAGRFLPPTCVRLLLDTKGRDRAAEHAHGELRGHCLSHKRKLATTLLTTLAEKLKEWFQQGRTLAEARAAEIVAAAKAVMTQQLDEEEQRLRALAAVNPNVHADELELLAARRALLAVHMDNAAVRLDAARVIVFQ